MKYALTTGLVLLFVGCNTTTTPEPTDDVSSGADTGQADAQADAERLPDHCDDVVMGEYEARNEGLDLNRSREAPDECDLVRGCEEGMRLIHWCATECPATHDCQPGGSWKTTEYKGGHAVVFVCNTDYRCPAD